MDEQDGDSSRDDVFNNSTIIERLCLVFQAAEGPGLAFIMYSEAIKNMPLSQLWSVLYFIMLLLLGVGSMLGNVTAIITPLRDLKFLSKVSGEMLNGKLRLILIELTSDFSQM